MNGVIAGITLRQLLSAADAAAAPAGRDPGPGGGPPSASARGRGTRAAIHLWPAGEPGGAHPDAAGGAPLRDRGDRRRDRGRDGGLPARQADQPADGGAHQAGGGGRLLCRGHLRADAAGGPDRCGGLGDGLVLGMVAAAAIGSLLYCTVFVALSLITARALVFGLAYVLIWEGLLAGLFRGTRNIQHQADDALVRPGHRRHPESDPRRPLGGDHRGCSGVVVVIGATGAGDRRLRIRDLPARPPSRGRIGYS